MSLPFVFPRLKFHFETHKIPFSSLHFSIVAMESLNFQEGNASLASTSLYACFPLHKGYILSISPFKQLLKSLPEHAHTRLGNSIRHKPQILLIYKDYVHLSLCSHS